MRLVQNMQMAVVEDVKASVDRHDAAAFRPQCGCQRSQRMARNQPKGVRVLKDFLRRHGRGSELADDDARRLVGDRHGRRMVRTGRPGESERRNHRVSRAAHIEHFPGESGNGELLGAVAAAEHHAVWSEREHHVGSQIRRQ